MRAKVKAMMEAVTEINKVADTYYENPGLNIIIKLVRAICKKDDADKIIEKLKA